MCNDQKIKLSVVGRVVVIQYLVNKNVFFPPKHDNFLLFGKKKSVPATY